MSFLELDNLTKAYGALTVVRDVDLSIDKGLLVCLLGPSGCGKTTTLRLIAGFIEPNGGRVRVGGRTVSSEQSTVPPEGRNMSMIFQSYALWPHMTVFENVAYGLKLRGLPKAEIASRVHAILDATRLTPLEGRYPGELSGGQQQRVSLARALVVKPEILLLDEPLSNLDANLREEMRFEIRRLHDEFRYTTVYVTHDQAEAMTTADIIVVMNEGRIEQAGTPEDIYERPESEFVARFIGGTNILKGGHAGDHAVRCDGDVVLRCGSGAFAANGDATAVSVRHHDIRIAESGPPNGAANWANGTIRRQIYLGSHRDYLVELPGGQTVRAVAPTQLAIPVGQRVWLHFPPEACRALAH
ncbi:ABC transporter ATP-binding protein [Marinivivus vitaminiproducens]|uniref:ABC transporter ATP-binding protein n=1 Tax=Marinivivus vitaminiproducens TaxID=3035935 RepID=UPI0027A5FCCF|nr:ABC transporter ATP-binding protein [Geminicoccaceae bacterium SCSIO 64248]